MRDFPPLYSAILRALADALTPELPPRRDTDQDEATILLVAAQIPQRR